MRHRLIHTAIAGSATLFVLALGLSAVAHDFWVQPFKFWIPPNSAVMTTLTVGHGDFRQRWNAEVDRVLRFNDIGPGGVVTDHLRELRTGDMNHDHMLAFGAAGTHVLVLQTGYAESVLPGIRFTDYIKQEGLTPAIDLRARSRTEDQPGREIYSRRAKALVQVGPASTQPQPWALKPVGLSLEIVPDTNPYAAGAGQDLPVHVLLDGRPLPGALVMLNNLDFDGRPLATVKTDSAGRAAFKTPRTGSWQLNVLWTKPLKGNPKADFDTTFSSLTFGFPPAGGAH